MMQLTSCSVDLTHGLVVQDGAERESLTDQERGLLAYLVDHAGEAVPRATLLQEVWGYSPKAVTRAVDVAVRRLRQKVEADPSQPDHVLTERGVGYRFVGPQPTAEAPSRHGLVGRGAELKRGHALMAAGSLLTLQGASGMGKTVLAKALCPQGAWLELHPLPDLASARAAHDALPSTGEWLVLDGLEGHLPEARAWVHHLVAAGQKVLVTSTQRLSLPDEQLVFVGGLPPDDGARLLRERARSLVAGWGEDDAALRAISEALDGWPLALELAAQRAPVLTASALLDALAKPERHGPLLRRAASDHRHARFDGAIERTIAQLSPVLLEAALQLAVFRGTPEVPDIEATVDLGHLDDPPWAIDWLQGLIGASVIQSVPLGGRPRFRLPSAIGRALRAQQPPGPSLRQRHAAVVLDAVEQAVAARYLPDWCHAEQRLVDLAPDLAVVRSNSQSPLRTRAAWLTSRAKLGSVRHRIEGLEQALSDQPEDGPWSGPLTLALAYEHLAANRAPEALATLEALSAEDVAAHRAEHGIVTAHAALLSRRPVDIDALPSVASLVADGAHEWVVRRLHIEAAWHANRSDLDAASACFARMRDWAVDHRHGLVRARALAELGQLCWTRGEVEPAEDLLGEALDLLDDTHAVARRAVVLLQLGGLEAWRGDGAAGCLYFQEGYDAFVRLGDRRYAAMAATNLGRVAYALGSLAKARRWLTTAEKLHGPGADPASRFQVALFHALTDRAAGQAEAASRHARVAVDIARTPLLRSLAEVVSQLCGGPAADSAPLRAHGAPLLSAWASLVDGGEVPGAVEPVTADLLVLLPSEWEAARG